MTRIAQSESSSNEAELTKTMMMIVASFLVCWIPMSLHLLGEAITEDWIFTEEILVDILSISSDQANNIALIIKSIVLVLTLLNSLADPIIFMTRMRNLREKVSEIFCRHSTLLGIQDSRINATVEIEL